MKHDLWDRMMHRLLQEKKEKEIKASKSKGSKPDFLDLDKDGNKTEPMSKAAKEAGGKKNSPKAKKDKGKIPPQLKMHIKKKSKLDEEIEKLEKILMEQPWASDYKGWDTPEYDEGEMFSDESDDDLEKDWYDVDVEEDEDDDEEPRYRRHHKLEEYGEDRHPDIDDDDEDFDLDDEDDDDLDWSSHGDEDDYDDEDEDIDDDDDAEDDFESQDISAEDSEGTEDIGNFVEEGVEYLSEAEVKAKKPRLGKVTRNPSGSKKKFHVYVKCGGRVKKISFGDPGLSIKRDSPARRKNFRARHKCDKPAGKDRCTARYWSCYQWRAGKKVEGE